MKKKKNIDWKIDRYAKIGAAGMLIILTMVCYLIYESGIIKGINPTADALRETIIETNNLKANIEGTFFDRNGIALTESNKPGESSKILYPNEMSYIIGTRNAVGQLDGLRYWLRHDLFDMGKKHKDGIGANVKLTINLGLQQRAARLLRGHIGSINVINADTGEILCMASRGHSTIDFDANKYSENFDVYQSHAGMTQNRAINESHAPGSTFKILTTMLILENDIDQSYKVEDPLYFPPDKTISNSIKIPNGTEIKLNRALYDSCNTYFATKGLLIGADKFYDIAKRFHIGEDIELDFTKLTKSNINPTGDDPDYELASTAYGQGKTQISPLHMTAIMASIMNEDRTMLKPYLISSIENEGEIVFTGESEVLTKEVTSKSIMKELRKLLHETALSYNYRFSEESSDYGYVIAKTGTADILVNGVKSNHAYLLIGYSYNEKNYAICIDWAEENAGTYGGDIKDTAKELINYINDTNP